MHVDNVKPIGDESESIFKNYMGIKNVIVENWLQFMHFIEIGAN